MDLSWANTNWPRAYRVITMYGDGGSTTHLDDMACCCLGCEAVEEKSSQNRAGEPLENGMFQAAGRCWHAVPMHTVCLSLFISAVCADRDVLVGAFLPQMVAGVKSNTSIRHPHTKGWKADFEIMWLAESCYHLLTTKG
jgi:hypothetical protein